MDIYNNTSSERDIRYFCLHSLYLKCKLMDAHIRYFTLYLGRFAANSNEGAHLLLYTKLSPATFVFW